jgi:glycosyltransferase involved in cell wall biosynthesis
MIPHLAAVVITKNEERHIAECLETLDWADECVVFDDFSADRTAQIAEALGARVELHRFENFAAQREAALERVQADWILFVDADERATPALADEVRHVIALADDRAKAGWWIPRHNYMIGHRMRGGGWYPDHQLRLLCRGKAHYDPARPVHETVDLDGEAGFLENVLIHYNYDSVSQFRHKTIRYTHLEARALHEKGTHVHPWTYGTMPLREFWRRYVTLQGYRDHLYGLLFSGLMAWYTFVTYLRLREIRLSAGDDP